MVLFQQPLLTFSHPSINRDVTELAPPVTANLLLNLDSRSGITKDGGDLVSQWDDLSGNANHAVQATGTNQPLWVDAEHNGVPTVRFDGSDNYMQDEPMAVAPSAQPVTFYVVCTQASATVGNRMLIQGGTLATTRTQFLNNILSQCKIFAGTTELIATSNTAYAQYQIEYNGSSSQGRRNEASYWSTGNAGVDFPSGYTLGAFDTAVGFADYDLTKFLMYEDLHTTGERDQIEAYMQAQFGVP